MSILMSSLCYDSSSKMNKIVLSADLIACHEIHTSPVRVVSWRLAGSRSRLSWYVCVGRGARKRRPHLPFSALSFHLTCLSPPYPSFPSPRLGPAAKVTWDGSGGREAEWDSGPEMVGDTGEDERERKGQGEASERWAKIKGGVRKSWTGWESGEWRERMSEVMEGKLNQGRCCSFIKKSGVLRHDGWFTADDSQTVLVCFCSGTSTNSSNRLLISRFFWVKEPKRYVCGVFFY